MRGSGSSAELRSQGLEISGTSGLNWEFADLEQKAMEPCKPSQFCVGLSDPHPRTACPQPVRLSPSLPLSSPRYLQAGSGNRQQQHPWV